MVKVRDCPTLTVWDPSWLEKTGGLFSAMVRKIVVTVAPPFASLVVRLTVKIPGVVYVWVAGLPLSSGEPSPQFQLNVKGPAPPIVVAVKVTD